MVTITDFSDELLNKGGVVSTIHQLIAKLHEARSLVARSCFSSNASQAPEMLARARLIIEDLECEIGIREGVYRLMGTRPKEIEWLRLTASEKRPCDFVEMMQKFADD